MACRAAQIAGAQDAIRRRPGGLDKADVSVCVPKLSEL